MSHPVGHEDLMRFLDDELPPDRRTAVVAHIEQCTECNRDLHVFRALKGDLKAIGERNGAGPSLWAAINHRLTQPLGWVLFVTGAVVIAGWAVWSYVSSPDVFWRKLAVGSVVIGAALLLLSAIVDRVRELPSDPYRQIQR
ncbi:MAG: anti-sigma factor family protein [Longimicrobiales bacterium]